MSTHGLFQALRLQSVRVENKLTKTLICDGEMPEAQPGQFVMAWLPGIGEKPFSIAAKEPFSLTVAAVGPVSEALCRLQPGKRVWVRGPLGQGFALQGHRHLLVGGGYGAAPLAFLAGEIINQKEDVTVCLGACTAKEVILASVFDRLGCRVRLNTEDGSLGERGLVTASLQAELTENRPDAVYACGPTPMLSAVNVLCAHFEVPCQLSWEAHMRCGLGLCGSCELPKEICEAVGLPKGWLVCKDGPVSHSRVTHD